jgi:SAM-dependent methyltransferase
MALTFDRSADVSKLEGCNTRGIEYRWSIFLDRIVHIPRGCDALDFGAGSLRESFDLVGRGFNVTSLDIDANTLASYQAKYSWPDNGTTHDLVATGDLIDALRQIDKRFELITCFDVLEHLEDPTCALRAIKEKLTPDGLILVTVPNGRTLFELAFRFDLMIARATKRYLRPGEPHLQRNSPERWKAIIADAGLNVVAHDMEIGFFANTFAAMVQLPLTFGGRVLRKLGIRINALDLSERIVNGPHATVLDRLDKRTKPLLRGLYGWNLFVISKESS